MKKILLLLCISLSFSLRAQVTLQTNPASIKWYQINTPSFRILYPKGFDEQAQRMANTLQTIHAPEARTMGEAPRKISVVLQSQSTTSNGFVTITPRHSEFYAMPTQNYNFVGTNDWMNLLASHEYRHIVQYQHATRGLNRLMYWVAGSNTLAALAHAGAPQWFWEGDAVATETAFTRSGRGRIPNFSLLFKTNLMEGRTFNYHKQYLRSYKHNIPDHYVLGYHMISYLRKRTNDAEIWEKITKHSWNIPIIPLTFSLAIKKETGLYVTQLFNEMASDLKKDWQAQLDQLTLTSFDRLNNRTSKAYADYLFPQPLIDGSVLVMKRGIGQIERFVRLKDGKEYNDFTPGFINETGMLSTANSKVVWNEFGFNPRWDVSNYSLLKVYDFDTNTKQVIGSRKERLAGAALSPDGSRIVTVRTGTDYKTNLVVFDIRSKSVVKTFENPDNDFISMARWTADGKKIVALRTKNNQRAVSLFDFESGTVMDLMASSEENIGYPVMVDHYILFNSPVTGIDNIFAYDIESQTKYQITSSKYGAYNPAVSTDGKMLYYNEQSRDGLDVAKINFDPSQWKKFEQRNIYISALAENLVQQEGRPNLFDSIPHQQYQVKRYSKLKGMLNPYSWGPFLDNSLAQANVGVVSQDILSTTAISAGYQYDINERTGMWKAKLSYQGLYPILDVSATYGKRNVNEGNITYITKITPTDTTYKTSDLRFKWTELNVEGGLRLPLNLTQSKFSSGLTISDYVGYTSTNNFENSIDGGGRLLPTKLPQYFFRNYLDHGNLIYNHVGFIAYNLLKKSRRDINSKWGQVIYVDAFNTPFGGDYSGNQFSFLGELYFPGAFKHHSLWGYWAYQKTDVPDVYLNTGAGLNNYTFRNQIPLPRGLSKYIGRMQNFYSMSANYTLPMWYPDIAIGPLLNLQRVRLNAFIDYGFGKSIFASKTYTNSFASIGGEVKFDFNIMRFLPQFNMGFRYSVGLKPSVTTFDFLLGTIPF
jgi:hypothetical protein